MATGYVGMEILLVMEEGKRSSEIMGLLNKEGFLVSRNSNYDSIMDLIKNKFFAVAIIDLDTPEQNSGLRILKKIRLYSKVTHPIMLSRHKCTANHVIKANNLGCYEFILLRDVVGDYLIDKVKLLAATISYDGERDRLLKKVSEVHNKFFKRMLWLHIKAMDAEENLIAISGIPDNELPPIQILIVDDSENLLHILQKTLTTELGWNFTHLTLASEALDMGASGDYHMAIINKTLPDLPGTMVASTIQSSGVNTKSLVFEYNNENLTEITLFESTGIKGNSISINDSSGMFSPKDAKIVESIENPVEIKSHNDLVGKIREVRQNLAAEERKSHYSKSFKAQNYDFLQEYSQLRSEIKTALERLEEITKSDIY